MKLLVIEDEKALLEEMLVFLTGQGYLCESAADFANGEEKIALYDYDVVILDLMLPGGDGIDLLRALRLKTSETGVLILSARDSLDDKLTGLDLGADDYLTKPFHMSELNARLQAIVRRRKFSGNDLLKTGDLVVDTRAQTATYEGKEITLTKKEFQLLLYFIINKNRVISKQAIAEHLWGDDYDLVDNYDFVYVHVKNMRKKLLAAGAPDYLKTVYGMGYKFSEA